MIHCVELLIPVEGSLHCQLLVIGTQLIEVCQRVVQRAEVACCRVHGVHLPSNIAAIAGVCSSVERVLVSIHVASLPTIASDNTWGSPILRSCDYLNLLWQRGLQCLASVAKLFLVDHIPAGVAGDGLVQTGVGRLYGHQLLRVLWTAALVGLWSASLACCPAFLPILGFSRYLVH